MKKIYTVIIFLSLLHSLGCASTLPDKRVIHDSYSIADVKTFGSVLNCENTKLTDIRPDFIKNYCQVLASNIKLALQRELPNLEYRENNPDLSVQSTLEEINGGSAAARLLIGFGAGRSITTVYVNISKNGKIIAEGRITETTTMPNVLTSNYANEDAILQDAPLIASRVGKFVKDPASFEKND
jgi:hypothetical protein